MANESKPGHKGKVTLGANKILGMTEFNLGSMTIAELDDTEFGDTYTEFEFGLITSGTQTVSGMYKKDDTQGQDMVREAMIYKSDITDIRFYVDSVSYYTPNSTTAAGGGLPAESPVSHVNIIGHETSFTVTDMGAFSMSLRTSGVWRLI